MISELKIFILTDNKKSWFIPYGRSLENNLKKIVKEVNYVNKVEDLRPCDILFLLSCEKIVPASALLPNKHNIVIHASDLPKGKGFSPLQWQILENKNIIVLSVIEAVSDVDAGPIYFKDTLEFNGNELYPELRDALATKIIEMSLTFVNEFKNMVPKPQLGEGSVYKRRVDKDDRLDINKTIEQQFQHLRIADNERFPVYFERNGERFYLKIYKEGDI